MTHLLTALCIVGVFAFFRWALPLIIHDILTMPAGECDE